MLKMPKILQALMYLLGVDRESICEPNSNLFFWKNAVKTLKYRVPKLMCEYQLLGEKSADFRAFNTLNYIEKLIAGLTQEEVDAYHPIFARLFKWLTAAITARKSDITRRKAMLKRDRETREQKLKEAEDRAEMRKTQLEEAEAKFLEDHREDIEKYEQY